MAAAGHIGDDGFFLYNAEDGLAALALPLFLQIKSDQGPLSVPVQ